jgi:GT2 family glycosyltransferase
MPSVAVVIPTYNGAGLVQACLETLLAESPESCERSIVVVDDGSSDHTFELAQDFPDVVFELRDANLGFAHTCNEGARLAGEVDYLVFLNNDTVPMTGWLDALVGEAESDPKIGAVGSRLLFPNRTIQHAGIFIGQDGWPRHLYSGFDADHPAVCHSRDLNAITAACMLVRRELFEQLGGFDPAFHNGYEDVDFCLRMRRQGWRVRYCADSVLYHLESVTRWPTGDAEPTDHNDRLYAERWLDQVVPDDVEHFLADGLLTVCYEPAFPLRLGVAPELAIVDRDGTTAVDDVLARRARQVTELLAKSTRIDVRRALEASAVVRRSQRDGGAGRARTVAQGEWHRLGSGPATRQVSVVMPLKNAAADLPEILPAVLGQQVDAELEIVAVDSGSTDETVAILREHGATVVSIEPADFDHGLTRNLAASYARGEVIAFLNGSSRPEPGTWLAPLLQAVADPAVAGACSRVLPRPEADMLTRRDAERELSADVERRAKFIASWEAYEAMTADERRVLLNFHTVGTVIRADVLKAVPFRSVSAIGEDLLWSREVLEAGWVLVHEPRSIVRHSHDYTLRELLARNVDDGIANEEINGRQLDAAQAVAVIRGLIADDWAYLRQRSELDPEEVERWQIESALRRVSQLVGQWVGVNHEQLPEAMVAELSHVAGIRRRAHSNEPRA